MCYSKEVSLATSGVIFASSGHAWYRYYLGHAKGAMKALDPRVRGFIKNAIIGFACIGAHQFFEFLSIWTGNQIIYKAGLLISISCMYFMLRALEELAAKPFGSNVFIAVICALGLFMAGQDMRFENAHFYVRGFSHYAWSMTWMMLFLYWNCCVINVAFQMKRGESRTLLLWYPWVFANFTYLLMLLYAFTATRFQQGASCAEVFAMSCSGITAALGDYQGLADLASIWCAFAVFSVFLIPKYFTALCERFRAVELAKLKGVTLPQAAGYVVLSGLTILFLNEYLPVITFTGLKMLTK